MNIKYSLLIITIGCLFLISCASAVTWTDAGGCWTATNGSNSIIMWNISGTSTWTAPYAGEYAYLIVAGGGGAGDSPAWGLSSGGGGAGGYIYCSTITLNAGDPITIIVGDGGAMQATPLTYGNNGINTSLKLNLTWINATGGGGGGTYAGNNYPPNSGRNGGSGGGGAYLSNPGSNVSGQGWAGGTGITGSPYNLAGGGGGAGGIGTSLGSGQGGIGKVNNITSDDITYAIGGNGGQNTTTNGTNATGGYGYGGHAGSGGTANGGAGTNGVVIIKFTSEPPVASYNIQLIDTSTNVPSSWQWNYTNLTGDNIPTTFSTSKNPLLTLSTTGNYLITLIASNGVGSGTTNKTIGINLSSLQVYFWNRTS